MRQTCAIFIAFLLTLISPLSQAVSFEQDKFANGADVIKHDDVYDRVLYQGPQGFSAVKASIENELNQTNVRRPLNPRAISTLMDFFYSHKTDKSRNLFSYLCMDLERARQGHTKETHLKDGKIRAIRNIPLTAEERSSAQESAQLLKGLYELALRYKTIPVEELKSLVTQSRHAFRFIPLIDNAIQGLEEDRIALAQEFRKQQSIERGGSAVRARITAKTIEISNFDDEAIDVYVDGFYVDTQAAGQIRTYLVREELHNVEAFLSSTGKRADIKIDYVDYSRSFYDPKDPVIQRVLKLEEACSTIFPQKMVEALAQEAAKAAPGESLLDGFERGVKSARKEEREKSRSELRDLAYAYFHFEQELKTAKDLENGRISGIEWTGGGVMTEKGRRLEAQRLTYGAITNLFDRTVKITSHLADITVPGFRYKESEKKKHESGVHKGFEGRFVYERGVLTKYVLQRETIRNGSYSYQPDNPKGYTDLIGEGKKGTEFRVFRIEQDQDGNFIPVGWDSREVVFADGSKEKLSFGGLGLVDAKTIQDERKIVAESQPGAVMTGISKVFDSLSAVFVRAPVAAGTFLASKITSDNRASVKILSYSASTWKEVLDTFGIENQGAAAMVKSNLGKWHWFNERAAIYEHLVEDSKEENRAKPFLLAGLDQESWNTSFKPEIMKLNIDDAEAMQATTGWRGTVEDLRIRARIADTQTDYAGYYRGEGTLIDNDTADSLRRKAFWLGLGQTTVELYGMGGGLKLTGNAAGSIWNMGRATKNAGAVAQASSAYFDALKLTGRLALNGAIYAPMVTDTVNAGLASAEIQDLIDHSPMESMTRARSYGMDDNDSSWTNSSGWTRERYLRGVRQDHTDRLISNIAVMALPMPRKVKDTSTPKGTRIAWELPITDLVTAPAKIYKSIRRARTIQPASQGNSGPVDTSAPAPAAVREIMAVGTDMASPHTAMADSMLAIKKMNTGAAQLQLRAQQTPVGKRKPIAEKTVETAESMKKELADSRGFSEVKPINGDALMAQHKAGNSQPLLDAYAGEGNYIVFSKKNHFYFEYEVGNNPKLAPIKDRRSGKK